MSYRHGYGYDYDYDWQRQRERERRAATRASQSFPKRVWSSFSLDNLPNQYHCNILRERGGSVIHEKAMEYLKDKPLNEKQLVSVKKHKYRAEGTTYLEEYLQERFDFVKKTKILLLEMTFVVSGF